MGAPPAVYKPAPPVDPSPSHRHPQGKEQRKNHSDHSVECKGGRRWSPRVPVEAPSEIFANLLAAHGEDSGSEANSGPVHQTGQYFGQSL